MCMDDRESYYMNIIELENENSETVHVIASAIAYLKAEQDKKTEQYGTRIYFGGGESIFVQEEIIGLLNFLKANKTSKE